MARVAIQSLKIHFKLTLTGNPASRVNIEVTPVDSGYTGTSQPIKGMFSAVVVGLGTIPAFHPPFG